MIRTAQSPLIITEFGGVNDFVDEVKLSPEMVQYCRGVYANRHGSLERLPGKKLVSSTAISTYGYVWAMRMLEFDTHRVFIFHSSRAHMLCTSDVLSGMVISMSSNNPMDNML